MTATSQPFGFSVVNTNAGGTPRQQEFYGAIASGYGTSIYYGQPVALSATGQLVPVSASGSDILGVFMGLEWVDSTGVPHVYPAWVGGTTYQTGSTLKAYVMTDPNAVYEVQADGSVPQTALGNQTNITNGTANGNGYSQATVSATLTGAGVQGQFRIIAFSQRPDNAAGDAYTIVRVQIAQNQFLANKVAI